MAENSLLDKLEHLVARFEEVSTLITDPDVISDMKRFVKLNKEYSDLEKIVEARNEYKNTLDAIQEAKNILENETDADLRQLAVSYTHLDVYKRQLIERATYTSCWQVSIFK